MLGNEYNGNINKKIIINYNYTSILNLLIQFLFYLYDIYIYYSTIIITLYLHDYTSYLLNNKNTFFLYNIHIMHLIINLIFAQIIRMLKITY